MKEKDQKFDPKSKEMQLVSYAHKTYRLWQPGTRCVTIRRDVIIVEPQPQQIARIVMPDDKDDSETTNKDIETEDDCTQIEKEGSEKPRKKYKKRTVEVRAEYCESNAQ